MEDLPPETRFYEVLAAQKVILRELVRMTMPHWIHLDLSMGQLRTLAALASHQAMNVSTLAETLEVSKPTASILVDQLVQRGLAERAEDPEDRRRTLVALSAAGSNMVAELRQYGPPDRMVRWLEAMDPDDLNALQRGLQALAAIIQRENTQAPMPSA
jgi:DNA-binding MarR family transcriptional regulator